MPLPNRIAPERRYVQPDSNGVEQLARLVRTLREGKVLKAAHQQRLSCAINDVMRILSDAGET